MPAAERSQIAQVGAAAARADLCRLLAGCYYEPGTHLAEEGVFESMRQAARVFDGTLASQASELAAAYGKESPEALLVDYTRLFLSPGVAKPYGCVWLGTEAAPLQGEDSVLALYAAGGFGLSDAFGELPDHIAAELEFLYLLIHREAAERSGGWQDGTRAGAELKRRLLASHLGAWVAPFAAEVGQCARTAFYRKLAAMTQRFVQLERQAAGIPAP